MTNLEKQRNDIRYKIRVVSENINNKYKNPLQILVVLSIRETIVEDQIFNSRIVNTI